MVAVLALALVAVPVAFAAKLKGTIPKRLSCYENNSVRLGKVKVTPGAYHLLVAVQFGPTGSSDKGSFMRRALTIKR